MNLAIPNNASSERLKFALFLAIALHAIIILGITFKGFDGKLPTPTLEITLVQYQSDTAPEKADFLAQYNQEASGTLDVKKEMTTTHRALFADATTRDATPKPELQSTTQKTVPQRELVKTTGKSSASAPAQPVEKLQETKQPIKAEQKNVVPIDPEIASLQARLSQQKQSYAKRPRIRTLTSVSTQSASDAEYLHYWREKVELIGNLNYPDEARRNRVYGELRLLVSLLPNGTVADIQVLESSGHRLLDDAAMRIVHLSAPFAPFSPALRKEVDRLDIIRTWRFEKSGQLTSQ